MKKILLAAIAAVCFSPLLARAQNIGCAVIPPDIPAAVIDNSEGASKAWFWLAEVKLTGKDGKETTYEYKLANDKHIPIEIGEIKQIPLPGQHAAGCRLNSMGVYSGMYQHATIIYGPAPVPLPPVPAPSLASYATGCRLDSQHAIGSIDNVAGGPKNLRVHLAFTYYDMYRAELAKHESDASILFLSDYDTQEITDFWGAPQGSASCSVALSY